MAHSLRFVLTLLPAILLGACAAPHRMDAVPRELSDRATALDNPAFRTWDDTLNPQFAAELFRAGGLEMELRAKAGQTGPLPPAYFLAISGGGANGAYGAGMLCGWTANGTRPEFKVVTGISTGALTAPFAFLGPAYDERLKTVYTSTTTKQIATERGMLAAIFDDALMGTAPLRTLMERLIDEQMMRDIAAEYARGRLLLVGTTNLDVNRGVIWNVGAIAASGDPKALQLIHALLLASAAIPAAFPPVMIDVQADGKVYQEMHVDGGCKAQVFLYPPSLALREVAAAQGISRDRVAYIIRNSRLDADWASTERLTLSIAGRAIDSLIQTQGIGDLYRLYLTTRRDGVDYNLAYIPPTFNVKPTEAFDPVYMSKLFDVGYAATVKSGGYVWDKRPPGFVEEHVAAPGVSSGPAAPAR
ncbi:MAG: patatin-like phospholipase family protein [Phycisphaerales bacterium]